jgi:regulation of enolase protein 1 (concanavalin A-like superfamily)
MSPSSHLPFAAHALTSPSDSTPSPSSTTFSLHPTPSKPTDIWRKPANPPAAPVTSFNAPIIYKSIPLSSFSRVKATISAAFKILYDQGGLVLVLNPKADSKEQKWIKTGVEFYKGKPFISTVTCDRFADWSLTSDGIKTTGSQTSVTLEIERDAKGGALWIYVVDGNERAPIREVTWILDIEQDTEVWVGVYAATPIMEGRGKEDGLEVKFEDWDLETK